MAQQFLSINYENSVSYNLMTNNNNNNNNSISLSNQQNFKNALLVPFKSENIPVRNTTHAFPIQNCSSSRSNSSNCISTSIEPISTNLGDTNLSPNTSCISPTFKSDDMPSLTPYSGHHNFNIFIPNGEYDETKRKGQTCVFQTAKDGTHQLFTKPSPHYWRLNYSIDTSSMMLPSGLFIRLVPVYGDPEKSQCVLERCARHKESTFPLENDPIKNRSVVLVEKTSARYIQDPVTHRYCVLLPFESPAEGQQYSSINCQFACYNSCFNQDSGGRKTLYLIVTLESIDETNKNRLEVLGRQCIQFRSCACPSRDWRDKKLDGGTNGTKYKRGNNTSSSSYGSTPIKMGGNDAIIRVLPSLPGLDDAIDNLIRGCLYTRAITQGNNLDGINEAFRQLKEIENHLIKRFTLISDTSSNEEIKNSPQQATSPDSQISNVNSSIYSDYTTIPNFPDTSIPNDYSPSYLVRQNYQFNQQNFPLKAYPFNNYTDIKMSQDLITDFGELAERSFRG